MNNRDSLARKTIAPKHELDAVRERAARKPERRMPLAETISIHGVRFPKDWRYRRNDLLSGAP